MNLQSLISELRTRQVKVWVDGEKLRYRTADGTLPSELRECVKQYRQELIEFLQQDDPSLSKARAITPVDRDSKLPLSFVEERLWFISSLSHDKPVFQALNAYRITGQLDPVLLERSLLNLVSRHEILRTRYVLEEGRLSRKIDEPDSFSLARSEIKHSATSSTDDELERLLQLERSRKINLTEECSFQAGLIQLPGEHCILLIKLHHIVYDDQSMTLMWQELSRNYDALVHARPLSQSALALQYADFACWQRSEALTGTEKHLAFWKKQLTGVPQVIALPTDFVRPLNQRYVGERLVRTLSAQQVQGLDHVCSNFNATRYMVLLALFSLLLHRYSQQKTILVGSPVSNRRSSELETMLGCFLDTVVLRTDFSPGLTFDELLSSVRNTTLESFEHQHVPFEKIVELVRPDRSSGVHPIFQVMFNFLQIKESAQGYSISGLDVKRIGRSGDVSADYDLSLTAVERQGQISCSFVYNRDLFKADSIARMADHFVGLLDEVTGNPQELLANYSMLSTAEKHLMLYQWNDTDVRYSRDIALSRLFEQQVRATPTGLALLYGDAGVSYAELNERANQLAHYLISIGVEKQSVVGVHLERSPDVTIALLAIFKINAVYLPLDPAYPAARLLRMVETSHARCLISRETLNSSIFPEHENFLRVLLDKQRSLLDSMPGTNPAITCSADDLAYIVFTSGSTGVPKGVNVPHRQILNRLCWMWREYPFSSGDINCQKTAISFVDSLWELLGPLLQGSPSVILSGNICQDPQRLLDQLTSHKVTRLWLVPTLLDLLLKTTKARNKAPPDLKFVVVSGEPLPSRLALEVSRQWPGVSLYNLYGTSEAWDSTWYEVIDVDSTLNNVPIGKPLDNTQIHILDEQLNPVPVGVIGQLYVSGDGLADSFIEGTNGSAEHFVRKPWDESRRMYASGDYARYLPDGTIYLSGRDHGYFNVRGFRVDPAEIENQICEIEGVGRAAVVQKRSSSGMSLLVAYVQVVDPGISTGSISETTLRLHLKLHLPAYMIPNSIVLLDHFPTTPSGKTDRMALEALDWHRPAEDMQTNGAPRTALQSEILSIWQSVLQKKAIGIHDDFFDLGGHSLMAVELFDKLARVAGSSLELTTLFDASTVADQAGLIRKLTIGRAQASLVVIRSEGTRIPLFLVPPAAGTGLNYRRLAHYLGDQQPVYTFNLAKAGSGGDKFEPMEMIAARLIEEMRTVRFQGPFVIGGMCFGGVVAWEMARQLRLSGQSLACVVMLDTSVPFNGPDWSDVWQKPRLRMVLRRNFNDLMDHGFNRRSRKRVFQRSLHKLIRPLSDRLQQFRELQSRQARALRCYRAVPVDADVLLICSKTFAERDGYMERWQSLIGGSLEPEILSDATHLEMLVDSNSHMQMIGNRINQFLDRKVNADS
ncbi:MAG: amino acid adenylation domain-containing protein [Rhodothermales bacterium]|nr:amino acid adenylation domain-containing protein [Rhodothermales bacterium]